jgi:hypothetical protein
VVFPVKAVQVALLGATAALLAVLSGCVDSATATSGSALALSGAEAARVAVEIEAELPAALAASRAVLLGTRDPNGPTCVPMRETGSTDEGYKPPPRGNLSGGPGNRMLEIFYWQHQAEVKSPSQDFAWCQKTLRAELVSLRSRSQAASAALAPVLAKVEWLERGLAEWPAWQDVRAATTGRRCSLCAGGAAKSAVAAATPAGGAEALSGQPLSPSTWPDHCRAQLSAAMKARDLAAAQRWARELRSALFALTDLHRWLELVAENELGALDFQKLGESLFTNMDERGDKEYSAVECISRFPGGSVGVTALNNYFEVERQAEGLFRRPDEYAAAAEKSGATLTRAPAAVWLTPDVREAFAALRARLSPSLAQTWDQAAALPYERSFLENHLDRLQRVRMIDALGAALERFAKRQPSATVDELMDIVVYRAALGMSGLEWADRFDPRVVEASGKLAAADRPAALRAAHQWAYDEVYKTSANYQGMVLSIRAAINTNKYDCIRGTDLIGALYRNAGWPGWLNVRWSLGEAGHTIGAVDAGEENGRRKIVTVDSLYHGERGEGSWPESYENRRSGPYSAELNGRGLDNYLMLEGHIAHGPNAGAHMWLAVPYLPGRATAKVEGGKG